MVVEVIAESLDVGDALVATLGSQVAREKDWGSWSVGHGKLLLG